MTTETLYKVLNDDGSCAHGGTGKWFLPHDKRPGRWMPAVNGKLIACLNGYHLCRASDLVYWLGPVIWEAEHDGDVLVAEDKLVVRRTRLLRRVSTWTEHSARLFAADCAEHVLSFFEEKYPNDTRPRQAIEAARLFAADNITAAAMIAAREAAWVAMEAAREVAGAAGEAAWVAALAARNAAWAAGESARESARKAAMEAAWTDRKATGVGTGRLVRRPWQLTYQDNGTVLCTVMGGTGRLVRRPWQQSNGGRRKGYCGISPAEQTQHKASAE